jgi:zinc D-Ala-D-Ala carboxypeptidase
MTLSDHFSLEELTSSSTARDRGIDNSVPDTADVVAALRRTAGLLEQVRGVLGSRPIIITSGYRCPELNRVVGGVADSAHVKGLAADIICPSFGSPLAVCRAIAESDITFDQLIHEHGDSALWTHIAVGTRGQVLHMVDGRYENGLPLTEGA